MTTRIKKVLAITSLAAAILPFGATEAFAAAPPRVRISADVDCLPEGGIGIDLTLENEGTRVARIQPGESRTFLLTAGEPFEGEPAIDFSGSRILIDIHVWLRHRDHPSVRTLSFSAC